MRNSMREPSSRRSRPSSPFVIVMAGVLTWGLAAAVPAQAHFLWLTADGDRGHPGVRAFLSETPMPEGPEFLKHIAKARITAGSRALSWTPQEQTYRVTVPEPCPTVIDGFCDLGVMRRHGATFRLLYTARVQFGPAPAAESDRADELRLRLVARPGRSPIVVVTFRGEPAAGAVVKAYPEEGDPAELKADAQGQVEHPGVSEGRVGLLAKWAEKTAGSVAGKPYDEVRYYATLTVGPAPSPAPGSASPAPGTRRTGAAGPAPFAELPEPVNSFGGAVLGDWLYVYSGHTGETHRYHEGTTTPHFRRLNLEDRTTWEELPCGPALQGVALVAHRDSLYRIGGMSAHNRPGSAHDLRSVAEFARYDPGTKTWTMMPPLPSRRSTHDAVVVGNDLYIVGGWSMNGGGSENAEFHEDALDFDLSRTDGRWEVLPSPPFRRRALAAASIRGKVYVLGGLTEARQVAKSVDLYDPQSRAWSRGPDLPGGPRQGFAPSAFGVGGKLYVSGFDGWVHRMNEAGTGWELAGKLVVPRLTHRLLPGRGADLLAVGGNFAGAPVRIVESISTSGSIAGPKAIAWTVPMSTQVRQGQAVALDRAGLIAVGGNRSAEPHAFTSSNLVGDGVRISLGRMSAEPFPTLPEPRQSASMVVAGSSGQGQGLVYLLGGIGPDGGRSRTLGDVFRLEPGAGSWTKLPGAIPDARGMFGALAYHEAIWLFGGHTWDPRPGPSETRWAVEVLRWDPARDGTGFEPTGVKLPRARRSFAGAGLGSRYYLVGGLGEDRALVEPVDVFDLESRTWSTIPAPARPRLFAELASLEGKLYLAGGYTKSESGHFQPAQAIEVYDLSVGTWSTLLENLPVPAGHVRVFPVQGRLLFFTMDRDKTGRADLALVAP